MTSLFLFGFVWFCFFVFLVCLFLGFVLVWDKMSLCISGSPGSYWNSQICLLICTGIKAVHHHTQLGGWLLLLFWQCKNTNPASAHHGLWGEADYWIVSALSSCLALPAIFSLGFGFAVWLEPILARLSLSILDDLSNHHVGRPFHTSSFSFFQFSLFIFTRFLQVLPKHVHWFPYRSICALIPT